MHKHFIVVSAIFLFSGCKMQEKTYHANLNDVADEYVKLTLAIGQYDPDFIEAYYGPEKWRPSGAKKEHLPYEEFKWQTNDLINQLKEIDDAAFERIEMQRYGFLMKQLHSVLTKLDMMAGKKYPFDVESLALYDAVAPHLDLSTFETLLDELELMVPGEGPLVDRYIKYSEKFVIPVDKLDTVFQAAILEARERTKLKIDLPENESLEVEYVKDQPWEAYNTYKGNANSLIRINTDLPFTIDWALYLACHEGYPGHHVYNVTLEQNLVIERQWSEYQVKTFYSPQSFIAEGSANFGAGMIFDFDQRLAFEKEVLYPLAGLNSESAEQFYQIQELRNQLAVAEIAIAREYINRSLSAEEAMKALRRYKQYTEEEAAQRIIFFDDYRSYVINFSIGEQLVKAHIDEAGADKDEQWTLFYDLLSTPYTASGL